MDLQNLEGSPEEVVWEAIEGCIEPLCTLRETVLKWQTAEPATAWKQEVATNMLLLLDPDVVAESRQPTRESTPADFSAAPVWDTPSPIPMTVSGHPAVHTLAPPPVKTLLPHQPTSLTDAKRQRTPHGLRQHVLNVPWLPRMQHDSPFASSVLVSSQLSVRQLSGWQHVGLYSMEEGCFLLRNLFHSVDVSRIHARRASGEDTTAAPLRMEKIIYTYIHIYIYMYIYIYTYVHTHTHTNTRTDKQRNGQACTDT